MEKIVDINSKTISDCLKRYKDIFSLEDFLHVNHGILYKDQISGAHNNTIEWNWCGIKLNVRFKNITKEKTDRSSTRFKLLIKWKKSSLWKLH